MNKKLKNKLKLTKKAFNQIKADHLKEYSDSLDNCMPGWKFPTAPYMLQILNVEIVLLERLLKK